MILERQCLPSLLCDCSLDIHTTQKLVLVWEAISIERTDGRCVRALPTKYHVLDNRVPMGPVLIFSFRDCHSVTYPSCALLSVYTIFFPLFSNTVL